MMKSLVLGLLFTLSIQVINAQKIDNLSSFRDIKSDRYFRFNYDNDYFAASDENYTQGYNLEFVAPYFKSNPANFLFYKPQAVALRYGLAVEHIGFTPDDYELPEIQEGDRPFAAAIMLRSFIVGVDEKHKSRYSSALSVGIIGPGAFGEEMQEGIHRATGNKIPLGWRNQIKNDIVLNYEVGYEKQLIRYRDLFSLQALTTARVGTLFTNASLGVSSTVGVINSPFTNTANRNGFKLYGYVQPTINFIGYDATLQGGVFNDKSPYTISSSAVERVTGQFNYGLILKTKTLYFEYSRFVSTREIATGDSFKWGGIKVGFTL